MNYGQIRTQFKALLNRSDCTDALADTFISQGISRSQRLLRIKNQEKTSATTMSSIVTTVTVPTDLVETITLDVDGDYLKFLPLQRFQELDYTFAGKPEYWTRIGNTIKFKPTPTAGQVVTLYYYGSFDPFVSDATETALSAAAPELFIYSGLVYASDYFLDDRKGSFEERYQAIATELQNQTTGLEGPASIQPAYSYGDD